MKVIDIMVKVANGEKVRFKILDDIEYYCEENQFLHNEYGKEVEWLIDSDWLNKEVEIIEEDKKIEKLEYSIDKDGYLSVNDFREHLLQIINKINEIIDYIINNK